MSEPVGDLHEYDVAIARMRTRSLIAETEPVLEDLRKQLTQARDLLDRLEEEEPS